MVVVIVEEEEGDEEEEERIEAKAGEVKMSEYENGAEFDLGRL